MARSHPTIFVLWGEHFDEAAAVIFVTIFRKAGRRLGCVKGRTASR